MNNQSMLSISRPRSMDDQANESLTKVHQLPVNVAEADVAFMPELGGNLTTHLHQFTTFLNIRKQLVEWISSAVSGAVSTL
ncbi:MAG: hypothetical protein AAF702_41650 [Chloroflexota bacterium]